MTADTSTKIIYKPVKLARVFANSGALPISKRPLCRLDYRLVELERWARKREVPLTLHPADPTLADKCAIALQQADVDIKAFVGATLAACWAAEKNIADEAVVRELLSTLDVNVDEIICLAQPEMIEASYEANTLEAITRGILGAPAYMYNNEQFWGQDRLDLLNDALNC